MLSNGARESTATAEIPAPISWQLPWNSAWLSKLLFIKREKRMAAHAVNHTGEEGGRDHAAGKNNGTI